MSVLCGQLEDENERTKEQVRELVRTQRRERALLLLQLRNYKEKQCDKIDAQLLGVMKMISDVEWEAMNVEAMRALQEGTQALKSIHAIMSPEDVLSLLEDSREAMEVLEIVPTSLI